MTVRRVDQWCYVRLPDGTRTRGRLVEHESELLLFTSGPVLRRFQLVDLDPRKKVATVDGGLLKWSPSCSCGWPTSLKGPVETLLEKLAA